MDLCIFAKLDGRWRVVVAPIVEERAYKILTTAQVLRLIARDECRVLSDTLSEGLDFTSKTEGLTEIDSDIFTFWYERGKANCTI